MDSQLSDEKMPILSDFSVDTVLLMAFISRDEESLFDASVRVNFIFEFYSFPSTLVYLK